MDLLATHKPSDCVLLIGVPSQPEDYDRYKRGELISPFLSRFFLTKLKFYNEVCRPLNDNIPLIESSGSRIIPSINYHSITEAFKSKVVVLFSHWEKDCIETQCGLISPNAFCDLIPTNYDGFLDLCACHPENLALTVKEKFPNCSVKYTDGFITPLLWIEIIKHTVDLLAHYELSYGEALNIVLQQFEKH